MCVCSQWKCPTTNNHKRKVPAMRKFRTFVEKMSLNKKVALISLYAILISFVFVFGKIV